MGKEEKNVKGNEELTSEANDKAMIGEEDEQSDGFFPPSEVLNEVLNDVPKEKRGVILQHFRMMGVGQVGNPSNEIAKKVTIQHPTRSSSSKRRKTRINTVEELRADDA